MKNTFKIFTLILLIAVTKSYSQAIEYDTVYSSPDTMPMYKDGDNGLSQYFTKELAACIKRDTTIIASCLRPVFASPTLNPPPPRLCLVR